MLESRFQMQSALDSIKFKDYYRWKHRHLRFYIGFGFGYWVEDYSKNKDQGYIGKVKVILLPFVIIKFGWLGFKRNK